MRVLISCIILVCLTACGKAPQTPEVLEYVDQFEKQYHVSAASITIELTDEDLGGQTIDGKCFQIPLLPGTIKITNTFWRGASTVRRELIVFHELGHCVFGRDHRDDTYPDGCPKSIMSTILMNEACYDWHKDDLLKELHGQ